MLTEAQVAEYRRILNVTPDQLGVRDPRVADNGRKAQPDRNGQLRAEDGTFAGTGRIHGKPATYVTGCRCAACRAANTARAQRYRRTRTTKASAS